MTVTNRSKNKRVNIKNICNTSNSIDEAVWRLIQNKLCVSKSEAKRYYIMHRSV